MVTITALNRKLLRDVWAIRAQIVAIALVLGAGIAMLVAYWGTFDSLRGAQSLYYDQYRFAEVFAHATRVPTPVREAIARIPGVAHAETRIVVDVALDLPAVPEPATGRLISIPVPQRPTLNDVRLIKGRWIEPGRPDEVLVSNAFAARNRLEPGSRVAAVINGRRRYLDTVGIVSSPEYVYSIRPGEIMPDDSRFGVFWMEQRALGAAFDLDGAFNDVAIVLAPAARSAPVIAELDVILGQYGGTGAIDRSQQLSHWFLDNELGQLQTMGTWLPTVFFIVAIFLVNLVLVRVVSVQRGQIASLKALGYSNRELARHYLGWGLVVVLIGAASGLAGGYWLGSAMVTLYTDYFELPMLHFTLQPGTAALAILAAVAAGVTGSLGAVWAAVRLAPAEAMRPESPARYRQTWVERAGLARLLSVPALMVFRNVSRRPVRATLSIVGIGFAAAMLVVGMFSLDAIDVLSTTQFDLSQRQDVMVAFTQTRSSRTIWEVVRLPGVRSAEPFRSVPVRLRSGRHTSNEVIVGLVSEPRLNRIINADGAAVTLHGQGLTLSRALAEQLDIQAGDVLTVDILEGARVSRPVPVDLLIDDYLGTNVYMQAAALHALLRESATLSGAFLEVDPAADEALFRQLKQTPAIAGVGRTKAAMDSFNSTIDRSMNIMIFFNVLFSSIIAVGVVYNAARVALSERSRELASLRVLGFFRAEISFILLGELATLTLVAVPIGLAMGYGLAALLVRALSTDLYRFPLVVSSRTFAFSAIVVAMAACASGLLVRRRLDRLDLLAVLKAAE